MKSNPLLAAQQSGQSIWLDFISRGLIVSGGLRKLIEEDGLRGVTSNPSIFDKAIANSEDYDGAIASLALQDHTPEQIYEALTVGDVQLATDEFRDLFDESDGGHGFVSLEVNPHLAYDTDGTVEEARHLWKKVDRPNVLIKVPATEPGLEAIRKLISEGINVNVTLLFGLPRYRRVAEAYMAGLEDRIAAGLPLDGVRSVASFFLSRIDVLVDPKLEDMMKPGSEGPAHKLHGEVAIASARIAYQMYRELFSDDRFNRLAHRGAAPQRVLWASTSTKNPDYSDVKYVEALIGPETVNTLPQETIDAFRDHGSAEPRLETGVEEARATLEQLSEVGIDIDEVTEQLEREGVDKFNRPYDSLMKTLSEAREKARAQSAASVNVAAGDAAGAVNDRLGALDKDRFCARLYEHDPGAWSDDGEVRRQISGSLGWLDAPAVMADRVTELLGFLREVDRAGIRHVVHMGMGGSSLAPLVFQRTFDTGDSGIPLTVLDTTSPETIAALEKEIPLEHTLFIVASKSGTTTEPLDFGEYFYQRVRKIKGDRAGGNFAAITDPGTPLADLARKRGFRRTFLNFEDVGGRYSALTYFGLVPAALMGVDISRLLERSHRMLRACRQCDSPGDNPGIALGAALGELARRGRDKVTIVAPQALKTFGMWLEQLLAESTGKQGRGLVPVAGEPVKEPDVYGDDRVFVHIRRDGGKDNNDDAVARLEKSGHPVVTMTLSDALDLGQEFLRWEVATATAGNVLDINPFDQPDVQAAKDATRDVISTYRDTGSLPDEKPDVDDNGLRVFGSGGAQSVDDAVGAFAALAKPGDYLAVLAYLPETERTAAALAKLREGAMERLKVATTVGYGPRYLHSTGQIHKGGPDTGLYLMFTTGGEPELDVPERGYSFGTLRLAQAAGDLEALRGRKRRVIRVHIGGDPAAGVQMVDGALRKVTGVSK